MNRSRFVYVWSTHSYDVPVPESEAKRTHILRTTESAQNSTRQIPVTYCSKRIDQYVTSPYPNSDLPLCERCKERAHA